MRVTASRRGRNVSQRFTQASPNPAKNKVKTCYPLRKDSGAVLCSSFDVGTPSSSDIKNNNKKNCRYHSVRANLFSSSSSLLNEAVAEKGRRLVGRSWETAEDASDLAALVCEIRAE